MPWFRSQRTSSSRCHLVVSFCSGRGKDGVMSSEPAVPPSEATPTVPPASTAPAPPVDTPKTPPAASLGGRVHQGGALWSAIFLGFLILIVLLIFVAQNTESASFAFLAGIGRLPLGVAILAARWAAAGRRPGRAARIFQLRRAQEEPEGGAERLSCRVVSGRSVRWTRATSPCRPSSRRCLRRSRPAS